MRNEYTVEQRDVFTIRDVTDGETEATVTLAEKYERVMPNATERRTNEWVFRLGLWFGFNGPSLLGFMVF